MSGQGRPQVGSVPLAGVVGALGGIVVGALFAGWKGALIGWVVGGWGVTLVAAFANVAVDERSNREEPVYDPDAELVYDPDVWETVK